METTYTGNEVLVVTNSHFFANEWQENDPRKNEQPHSRAQKIIGACWNGLLPALLPECFENVFNREMLLWEVTEAAHFIELDYGTAYHLIDAEYSINPYLFMEETVYN